MSKTIPSDLALDYALGTHTLAEALLITRSDGILYAFTSHDRDVRIDGVVYDSVNGLDITQLVTSAATTVDNMEITTLDDGSIFTKSDIRAGIWVNSRFVIFRYNFEAPQHGIDILLTGYLGEVTPKATSIVVELRGLQQFLQQPVGDPSSKTCRAELGDSRCKVDLTPYTVTGTITSVTSSQQFRDSSRTETDDWFTNGLITWTSGDSDGLKQRVKLYSADGTIVLNIGMTQPVQIGDTYTMVAGCTKRVDEDCTEKFNNVLNFVGEPHRPGVDVLTAAPTAGV